MSIQVVEGTHVRVTCEICRKTAELCGKRELESAAVAHAVQKFLAANWHHDPVARGNWRAKTPEQIQGEGSGRWYCPACARRAR